MGDPKNVRKERCELILVLLFAIRQPLIIFFQCGDSGDTLSISEKSYGNVNSDIKKHEFLLFIRGTKRGLP